MIWQLTKDNHRLSINPWVRWWLKRAFLFRLVIAPIASSAFVSSALLILVGLVHLIALVIGARSSSFFRMYAAANAMGGIVGFLTLVGVIWGRRRTGHDIEKLESYSSIVLATRGEYIGGHPELPHGRFVYLALGGSLENPELTILLPRPDNEPVEHYPMPVLDVKKTTQDSEKTGDSLSLSTMVAGVTFRTKFIGEEASLNVEYGGAGGRQHHVELERFFFGNGEIRNWRNHIVCIQAQADTGVKPHAPWKALPSTGRR